MNNNEALNILTVATTGTNHFTTSDVFTDYQVRRSPICTKRQSGGYVVPAGTRQATCPKCLAKI